MVAVDWPETDDEEPEPPDTTPRQEPTLSPAEATLVRTRDTRQARIEWLMVPEAPELQSLLDLFERPDWHRQAACKGADPDLFFPERGTRRPVQALAYCESCPVRQECLASALKVATTTGVWGGTTGQARKGLRRSVA
jgi:WhiB family redox-sensing transcriptional regulator